MSQEKLKNIIEAALMVSSQPLSVARIASLFEADESMNPENADIRTALEALQNDYQDRGIELVEVASGFRVQARNDYAEWVNHLFDERPPRYSRALLETLAIIAYRQPITRGEIEEIRGVSVSSTIIKTLQEREWIKVVGQRDVPGKPSLLATTKLFLDYFNLKKLSDLPSLEDIKDFDSINPDLFEELEGEAVKENADAENSVNNESESEASDEIVAEAANDDSDEAEASDETDAVEEVETEIEAIEQADDSDENDNEESGTQADEFEEDGKVVPFTN